jgi:tetratricopeptide (TPR) repeat protein
MKTKFLFLILFYWGITTELNAQANEIDSVRNEITRLKASENFTPNSTVYIDLLFVLSEKLMYSKADTIKSIAEKTMLLSQKINYPKGKIKSLYNFGIHAFYSGNTDQSYDYFEEVLNESLNLDFPRISIQAYNGLSIVNNTRSQYAEMYINILKALEIAEKIDDAELIIKMTSNLGTMFSLLEDYDEALKYYIIAQDKFNNSTAPAVKALVIANLGYLSLQKKEFVKALEYLNLSIKISKKEDAKRFLAFAYTTKGELYNQLKEYDKALVHFGLAEHIYNTTKFKNDEADFRYYSGTTHYHLGNLDIAEEIITQSLELYTALTKQSGMEKCYRVLYLIDKEKGRNNNALANLELARFYSDSVETEKKKRDISMLKAKLSFEKSKVEIKRQNQLKLDNQKKYVLWITMGLIGTMLTAFIVFRVNRTKRKLNQELTIQAAVLSNKQEELNNINNNQDKLFSIVGHDLRGPILSLKQLLGTALEKDTEIEQFYTYGPKLKKDVDHIHFTLDNLLNWGLTQMKGDITKPVSIHVKEVLLENELFFSEALAKKNITVTNGCSLD